MSMNTVPNLAGGGEPPYDKGMDRRLTVLETRFDTILPTLATKADLEALRVEMERLRGEFYREMEKLRADVAKSINDAIKWMIGIVVSLFIGILAVNIAMFNTLNSRITDLQASMKAIQTSTVAAHPPILPPQTSPRAP